MKRPIASMIFRLVLIGVVCGAEAQAAPRTTMIVEVQAGTAERRDVPLSVAISAEMAAAKHLWMQRLDKGTTVPLQRTRGDAPQVVWMLRDRLPARQARRYRVTASEFARNRETPVTVTDDGQALTFRVRNKPVLTYHTSVLMPPSGIDPIFQRSGFIHPLLTPGGRVLTEPFPADHLHQHGIFNAWVKTKYDGRDVDFWNQQASTGTVEHVEVTSVVSGPVFAQFTAKLRHIDLSAGDEPVVVLDETWTVRVYDRSDQFMIDLESQQLCATKLPLTLEEYHYGGMAFRGTSEWLGQSESNFLTSEGKSRADGNHTRPHWTDAYGLVGGQLCGVAVLQHPSNERFPAPVRLHPDKPYFVYTPVALGEMTIEPDKPLIARYRYLVHDGPPDAARLDAAWSNYSEPPTVRIIK